MRAPDQIASHSFSRLFYNSETGRPTWLGSLAAVGAMAGAIACGGNKAKPVPTDQAAPERPGSSQMALTWPGKVALGTQCPSWSSALRGPKTISGSEITVVVDARLAFPRQCDPVKDSGAGTQSGASAHGGSIKMPAGERYNQSEHGSYIVDGTTFRVTAWAVGEMACRSDGSEPDNLWLKGQAAPTDPMVWISNVNAGYALTVDELGASTLPLDPEQSAAYGHARQGGC